MSEPSNERWQRAKSLFHQAVERPADEREAFLRKACGDDPDLFGQVLSLLAQHETADGQPTTQLTVPLTEKPGTRIGPYKLLQRIGEGGFGSVFLADQESPVRRRVALKIIKLGMDTRQVIARFEAERQALAMMDHPNIARVLDGGTTDSGRPYFVMEYVIGDVITRFADAHRLGVPERLTLFSQVCQAVQHAHTKGIIHRDLKPANVLVSMTDGRPFAKVIDFGIAKATSGGAVRLTDKTLFTEHQQLIGTPEYMSPEQAQGSPDIDTRTDVYALGVLLYELLTGLTPFDAKRLRSAAWAEMQRIIREEDPPAPSMRLTRNLETLAATAAARKAEPDKLSGLIKGELDWIVMKSLDKDRGRRYESASQFAADVERHLAGEAVVAAPPGAGYRLRKLVRKHRGAVLTGGAITAALLVRIVGTTWQWREATTANTKLRESYEFARKSTIAMLALLDERDADASLVEVRALNEKLEHQYDPLLAMSAVALDTARGVVRAKAELKAQVHSAEWSAYIANLALAQSAMESQNWPEARRRLAACPESQRGWEWKFLNLRAKSILAAMPATGSTSLPRSQLVACAPDGNLILTLSEPSTAQLRDTSGRLVGAPMSHGEWSIKFANFSRDGNLVLTADWDGTARLWDLAGEPVGEPMHHAGELTTATFSPDSKQVLTAGGGTGQVWDTGGNPVGALLRSGGRLPWQFSPDGSKLLVGSDDRTAIMLDLNGRVIGNPMRHNTWIRTATFSSDGTRVLTGTEGGTAQMWDEAGEPIGVAMEHAETVYRAVLSADGSRVLTSAGGAARLWDAKGRPITESMRHEGVGWLPVWAAFDPQGTRILTVSSDGTARLWDLFGRCIGIIDFDDFVGDSSPNASLKTWGPDSEFAIVTAGDFAFILDAAQFDGSNRFVEWSSEPELQAQALLRADTTADGTSQAPASVSIGTDGTPKVQWTDRSRAAIPLEGYQGVAVATAVDPAGERVVAAFEDRTVRFWETHQGREVAGMLLPVPAIKLDFTPDGAQLVITLASDPDGMLDGTPLRVWDTRPAEARQADRDRRAAERKDAEPYVDDMLAGKAEAEAIESAIRAEPTLTPLRRLMALDVLRERVSAYEFAAERAFKRISDGQTDKATVEAAAIAADLPPRVKALVIDKAAEWEY